MAFWVLTLLSFIIIFQANGPVFMFNFMNTGLFVVSKDNNATFLIPNVLRSL